MTDHYRLECTAWQMDKSADDGRLPPWQYSQSKYKREDIHMKYLSIVALLVIVMGPAHAYIDGGSGSYLVQMAVAGFLALAFSVKLAWQRIKGTVSRICTGQNSTANKRTQ